MSSVRRCTSQGERFHNLRLAAFSKPQNKEKGANRVTSGPRKAPTPNNGSVVEVRSLMTQQRPHMPQVRPDTVK